MAPTEEFQHEAVRDFHHPYKPYDIQNDLMKVIYECIEGGKIGILESPTGTGKSLSLICGSLTWLRDFQEKTLQGRPSTEGASDEPEWVFQYEQEEKRKAAVEQKLVVEARLKLIRAKELRQKQRYGNGEPTAKRRKTGTDDINPELGNDAQFELANYSSDDEPKQSKGAGENSGEGLSSESQQLMEKLGLVFKSSLDEDLQPSDEIKIFFCSRTHSQLTQFVQELRRVDLPEPQWITEENDAEADKQAEKVVIKHLPLGSRKNLCINPKVSNLGSLQAINERCLELQQPSTSKDQKCAFMPKQENETLVNDLRDLTLAKVRDIEDLGLLGQKIGICPYYASRATIKPSEIVTLPYPLLLQKSAREALGLSLRGHVIVVDEAHNLMDTIVSIHSSTVTSRQLKRCREQIRLYLQKFRNRLKGKNRVYVAQAVRLLDSIAAYLDSKVTGTSLAGGVVEVADLLAGKGVDQINLYKLVHYLQESKLARKVEGYAAQIEQEELKKDPKPGPDARNPAMPVLTHVQSFLETLTNPAAEGRFFYERDENKELCLRYILLDPTHHFKAIVEDARAVILAGGTMSPMDDYMQHLFSYVDPSRIRAFSCGHIIPKENLLALPLNKGVGGIEFDFTFERRNTPAVMEALGNSLIEVSGGIPDGLVVFFPSYAYLDQVIAFWKTKLIWTRLQDQKPTFQEAKTAGVDAILSSYSESIANKKGGLLLAVIGGKLSEGINFSDALGRGIVVVGMPYPNIHNAQWKAKLEYIDQSTTARTGRKEEGKAAARAFVENACMRAVNQSIGRAIRHKGDYASILLLDKRYGSERIEGKLPAWIRQCIVHIEGKGFGAVTENLRTFFLAKQGTY